MTCTSPPELTDLQIAMFLDGEAGDDVVRHLGQCPFCREKAARLARFQGNVAAQLYRVTCPSPEELRDYHFDLLPGARSAAVTRHLAKCPHCTREFALLNAYLGDMPAAPSVGLAQRIRTLVARLVQEGMEGLTPGPGLAPAFAVRGEEEGTLVYEVDDATIGVDIIDDREQPGHKNLEGTIVGMEMHQLQIHLWRDNQLVATAPVDAIGSFVIPHLAPGNYELIVSSSELKIHIPDLRVGDA